MTSVVVAGKVVLPLEGLIDMEKNRTFGERTR